MKLKSTLLAAALAVFATAAATVFAAEEYQANVKVEKTEAAKTGNGEAAKPEKKKMKKHSHMTEKTGMPVPDPVPAKKAPKNRHDHTQDRH